jgi:hypothetical protein
MPRQTTLSATQQLHRALSEAGYTPTQIGTAVLPGASSSTRYRAGYRLALGAAPTLDRVAELARILGVTVTISPGGVDVTRSAVDGMPTVA